MPNDRTQATEKAERGLEPRYRVEKINDPTGRHAECRYFVLDPQHDPLAEQALRWYAQAARREGFLALADDLDAWVGTCHEGMKPHGPHGWWEITIAGEVWEECPGRPSENPTPPGDGSGS